MRRRNWLLFALVLIVIVGALRVEGAGEKPTGEKVAADTASRFKGKITLVYMDGPPGAEEYGDSAFLKDAVVENIGGRYFITGHSYLPVYMTKDPEQNWVDGAEISIAWDSVSSFYVYTPERAKEAFKDAPDGKDRSL